MEWLGSSTRRISRSAPTPSDAATPPRCADVPPTWPFGPIHASNAADGPTRRRGAAGSDPTPDHPRAGQIGLDSPRKKSVNVRQPARAAMATGAANPQQPHSPRKGGHHPCQKNNNPTK